MQKTFRLFVSSTFSDFNEERIILQTKVFPEIKKYCTSKGLNFQPIDLRWGVSAEAQLDQKTLELCLNEVRSSKVNPHPNFLIMAGDRYGWIPLPYLIEQNEFESILNQIENSEDKELLNSWYKLDLNQIPASYILNERKDEYVDYAPWEEVETKLRIILQTVVSNLDLKPEEKSKYFTSATEAEVIEGIFKYLDKTPSQNELLNKDETLEQKDYEHVYAYIRNIDSIDNLKDKFKDVNPDDVKRFKKTLKESIKKENLYEVNVNLKEVDQDKTNHSLNYKYEELASFEDKILNYLKNSINAYLENIEDITPQELESYEQNRFKNDKLKDFLPGSREEALETIDNYINSNETQALVVYGKSGLGKSSLIAKAIEDTQSKYTTKKTIYRFAGSTANLSTSVDILISILNELGIKEEIRKVQNPQTMQEENEKIEEFYERVHDHFKSLEQNTIIFLDAIDQVNNEDNFLWLPKELPLNVKFIISALDDGYYEEDSKYFDSLKTISNNLYQLQEFDTTQSKELILSMLEKYNRTITNSQMEFILNIFEYEKKKYKEEAKVLHKLVMKENKSPQFFINDILNESNYVYTPLFFTILVEELKFCKSTDKDLIIPKRNEEMVDIYIFNLSKFYHHNKEFVKRVFSYLYLTQGLSESEILEVLNSDEKFISYIAPDTHHNNLTKELPMVIWARLHKQILKFLKLENKHGQETMSFFHREFNEFISNQEDLKEIYEHLIRIVQNLTIEYQNEDFNSNRWGKLYVELLKNYFILYESKIFIFNKDNLLNNNYLKELLEYIKIKSSISIYKPEEMDSYIFLGLNISEFIYNNNKDLIWFDYYYYFTTMNSLLHLNKGEILKVREIHTSILLEIQELIKKDISYAHYFIQSLNEIATTFLHLKDYNQAIEYYIYILEFEKNIELNNKLDLTEYYVAALQNLYVAYWDSSQTKKASEIEKKLYVLLGKLFEQDNQKWVDDYVKFLNTYSLHNNSEELFEKSLEIIQKFYSQDNVKWLKRYTSTLESYVVVLGELKKEKDSIKYLEELVLIYSKEFNKNQLLVMNKYITILNVLIKNYLKFNLYEEALKYSTKLYEVIEKKYVLNDFSNNNEIIFLCLDLLKYNKVIKSKLDSSFEIRRIDVETYQILESLGFKNSSFSFFRILWIIVFGYLIYKFFF